MLHLHFVKYSSFALYERQALCCRHTLPIFHTFPHSYVDFLGGTVQFKSGQVAQVTA